MNNSFRFWLILGGPAFAAAYLPSVLEYNDASLKCTYVPKNSESTEVLFDLTWDQIAGYYYNSGGKAADSISIFTLDNTQYTFNRQAKNTDKFPEVLAELCPDDKHKFIELKPSKEIKEIEQVLTSHNVGVYKMSFWKRLVR